ncbi:Serine/threonine protein kinase [Enhygromyxa salina]|uniref:Serine/threonine protein kinase n=1 Tax=Enhygromyxa salina TaxID=215803 RepID=A0A0C2D2U8_9BACT|nr:Serine/threonine protein kinase [Enhygromyxa salina]
MRFGVRALQLGYIDDHQFADACTAWVRDGQRSLAELMCARGWVTEQQRSDLEHHAGAETHTVVRAGNRVDDRLMLTLHANGPRDSVLDLEPADFANLPLTVRQRITLRGIHSSGGIGEVWRAYDEVLGREIALKRLKHSQAAHVDSRARFFREARITGQLDHPGVVPVYDYSHAQDDGAHCFYTMRFLQGRTLSEVIADFHDNRSADEDMVSRPLLQLLQYFISVCNTMAFAHSRGIVHRDLKGANVIIGDFGEVIVLDWGLAKHVGSGNVSADASSAPDPGDSLAGLMPTATLQGDLLGTPAFMSLEQAKGEVERIDRRTDIYSLCAILYDILTGRPPFDGDDVAAIMDAVIRQPPTPPRALVPGVPVELERICLCGLAKAPEARWHTVGELGDAVERWLTTLAERKRTDQERERFFDLSVDLLAIVDSGGHIAQFNMAWTTLLGWPSESLDGAVLTEFACEDQRASLTAGLAKIWAGESDVELELRMRCADGSSRWIDIRARSIPDEAGVYLVGRDVTDRRRSEQKFMGLLESAPDATCVIDRSGTIVLINHQLERMFGYSQEELLDQPIEILVPEHLRGRHVGHVRGFVSDPTPRPMGSGLKLQGQRKDGTTFAVEVSLGVLETETQMLVSCALRAR